MNWRIKVPEPYFASIKLSMRKTNFIYIILFLWHVKTRIITLKSSIFIFQNLCQSAYDWLTAYDSEIYFNHFNRKLVWAMRGLSVSQALDNFPYWLWPIRTNQDAIPSIATQSIAISDTSFMLNVKHWNIIWQRRRKDFFDYQQKLLARWLACLSNTYTMFHKTIDYILYCPWKILKSFL